jgi:hypothetical protein
MGFVVSDGNTMGRLNGHPTPLGRMAAGDFSGGFGDQGDSDELNLCRRVNSPIDRRSILIPAPRTKPERSTGPGEPATARTRRDPSVRSA